MKNKITSLVFIIYVFTFAILGIVIKDKEISVSERRALNDFPEYKMNSDYVTKLEQYLLEQFPFRDEFRSLKANYNYYVLNKLENNNIYLKDDYIFKSEYPTNVKSIDNFMKIINSHKENLNDQNKVFVMIVPDKNYYLNDNLFLQIDYEYIFDEVNELDVETIDIRDIMELNDYYETDIHWRQEKLDKVIQKMNKAMNFEYESQDYQQCIYDSFYGGYYGEAAINRQPEKLIYLKNDILDNVKVEYLENNNLHTIYNPDKLSGLDSYDVFLDGASSFIEITNENSITDKELVIFRDSFGSSITPLLVPYYKKITLIDIRYMYSFNYLELIEFTNQDVLFLYNTVIVNSSFALRN